MGQPLWIANAGTAHELFIFSENGRFYVDNVRSSHGSKCWEEFPRMSKTVKGCKISAARIMGESINWTRVKQEPRP